jgi:alpha-tubulin suppressor-like RCC1 family protein
MILTERGHVYYCGRHRSVAEAVMRPTLLDALANNNHVVTHIAAGNATVVCSTANGATVSWGMGAFYACLLSTSVFGLALMTMVALCIT